MSLPILYPSTETAFVTNGLGILADALQCTVTEERNGMFELEMHYPITGVHYSDIALRNLIMAKPNPVDEAQPFRVYRITKPMNGIVTVYARHISYDLNGIPAQPFTAPNAPAAMQALKTNAVTPCPFTFWTDKTTTATMTNSTPLSIRSLLGGVRGSVLDVYGGEYAFDRYLVRLYNARGVNRGVSIRYGKNLKSLEQDENCTAVYTGVYPYWTDSDGNLMQLQEKIVNAPGTYNFVRILTLDLSGEWQEKPTEAQLRTRAQRYITENNIGVPKMSLSISFVQLEQYEEYKNLALLERVSLCDTVNVEFPRLGVSATAKVYKTVYDVLRDRWESVDLGDARTTLAETIAAQGEKISEAQLETVSFLQKAVDNATSLITGNKGGYVILHSSTGGKEPDEILIMDTPDIKTAKKVWRWNKAGLGYSSKGYNGPYGLAMTQDGKIVADYIATGTLDAALANIINLNASNINTGTLNADLIKTGALRSENGESYIDLDTGNASLTGVLESTQSSSTKNVKSHVDWNGFWTQSQSGELRGVYVTDTGETAGVLDQLQIVADGGGGTFGKPLIVFDVGANGLPQITFYSPTDFKQHFAIGLSKNNAGNIIPIISCYNGDENVSNIKFGADGELALPSKITIGGLQVNLRSTETTSGETLWYWGL